MCGRLGVMLRATRSSCWARLPHYHHVREVLAGLLLVRLGLHVALDAVLEEFTILLLDWILGGTERLVWPLARDVLIGKVVEHLVVLHQVGGRKVRLSLRSSCTSLIGLIGAVEAVVHCRRAMLDLFCRSLALR